MALLNGLNLIPSSFLPTFFPSFLPSLLFSSPLTPFLLPSPNPREARRLFLAGEGGPWGPHASRIGVSGKNMGCQESGGQEPPKCFLVSHKGDGDFFFFNHRTWLSTATGQPPARSRTWVFWDVLKESSGGEQHVGPPLCNATGRLPLSKQSQTPALPEVKSLSACAPGRSGFGLIFGPRGSKLGAGSEGGGGLGAECGLASPAAGSPLLLQDFFFFFNLEFPDDKKEVSTGSEGAINIY